MRPTYFDLTVTDLDSAREFFEHALGWQFERFAMPYEYYRIKTGSPDKPGIDGGIGEASDAPIAGGRPMTLVTIQVDEIDEVLSRVREGGGKVIEPKMPIPSIGWYATCSEPGGLMFGILEADPSVQ